MSGQPYASHEITVTLDRYRGGEAKITVWVHLRGGGIAAAYTDHWPAGAPTPHALELLEAAVVDQVQLLILQRCGVQGALLAEG